MKVARQELHNQEPLPCLKQWPIDVTSSSPLSLRFTYQRAKLIGHFLKKSSRTKLGHRRERLRSGLARRLLTNSEWTTARYRWNCEVRHRVQIIALTRRAQFQSGNSRTQDAFLMQRCHSLERLQIPVEFDVTGLAWLLRPSRPSVSCC